MPTEGSSRISRTKRKTVKTRDHHQCVLCGYRQSITVAHVLARNDQRDKEIEEMMAISEELNGFRKDDTRNLLSLCPNHHAEYDQGAFVFLPGPEARALMKAHEEKDFASRQESATNTGTITSRTLPFMLTPTIEYIPIKYDYPDDISVHLPTPWDNQIYPFSPKVHPHPVISYAQISPYALMWESEPFITQLERLESKRTDAAIEETKALFQLYRREPQLPVKSPTSQEVIADSQLEQFTQMMAAMNTVNMSASSPEIPKPSPRQGAQNESVETPTNSKSESESTHSSSGGSFVLEDDEDGLDAETALSAYQNEPGVTPEILDGRTPLYPGKPPGRWWEYALHGF